MTPEQALALLKLAESAGVGLPADGVDEAVTAEEKVLALATIAGLEWEYAVEVQWCGRKWCLPGMDGGCTNWHSTTSEALTHYINGFGEGNPGITGTRMIRRLVGKTEVME